MIDVLMGGFAAEAGQELQRCLGEARVTCVQRGAEVLERLSQGVISLLILDDRLSSPPALDVLQNVRSREIWRNIPVIYCLEEGSGAGLVKRLAKDFEVQEVMLPPLDSHELVWKSGRLLGIPIFREAVGAEGIQAAVASVRSRFMGVILDRVCVLEQAGTALLERNLSPELRASAGREAHKLAGLLGTIGFSAGSRYAREIEEVLTSNLLLTEAHALRLSELAVALRLDLEKSSLTSLADPESGDGQLSLLVIDGDRELSERLEAEAEVRSWRVEVSLDFSSARNAVVTAAPDVILLDPHLSKNPEEGLALIEEMSSRSPAIPVIVLTSRDTFTDRVEVARRGGRGFLSKSSSGSRIAEAASQLLSRLRAADTRIMAVDDDPQMLAFVRSLLEPRGLRVATLHDPLQFWDQLEAFSPDLLLLDVDMPCLGGVELCRVVRNDARWADTPILFLTRHNDPETVDRVFSAGADDFVAKPIVGPELLTRVFNRIEQTRLRRSIAETDPLTGAFNRPKFSRATKDFLELGRRHAQPLALALIEPDSLRQINHRYGHAAGDSILQRAGAILREAFRSEDVLGRLNGCQFAAGMYGLSRYDGVQRLNGLQATIQKERFRGRGGEEIQVSFSAGVAAFDDDGEDLEALYGAAESALVEARKAGGGRVMPAGWHASGQHASKRLDVALMMKDEAQACLLMHLLETRGCRTQWLRNGKTAAKLLGGPKPAIYPKVALLDLDLPGVDGLSLLKRMATDGSVPETRAIVLTSPSVSNGAQMALELGAFDCVVKPINPGVVAQHICRALDRYR